MGRQPTVRVAPPSPHQLDRTITVGSDAGGCLISVMVRDGRLRIEVYRADDTVDVIAPAPARRTARRPRDTHDQQMTDGGVRHAE